MTLLQRKFKILSLTIMFVLMWWAQTSYAARLNEIRAWHSPERTRVVLDLDKAAKFKYFYLTNPSRFVVDLSGFSLNPNALAKTKNGPFIKGIRIGMPQKNIARVVLDLNQRVKIDTLVLAPVQDFRHRLVLDIYPKGGASAVGAVKNTKTKPSAPTKPSESPKPKGVPKKAKDQDILISIDAGHGGEDLGARGLRSAEKKIVLQIAKRLKRKIDAQAGMRAVLTRKGDYFISLRKRTELARQHGADLFVSIHADGFKNKSARGSSVYALSLRGATSETARWLANKENAADLAGGVNISSRDAGVAKVLLDLSMDSTQHESISYASAVLSQLKKIGKIHNNTVERAGFVVLKSPDIPSILIETAFITNRTEEKLLRSERHQEKLANAILQGTITYLKHSTYHTANAQQ